MSTAAKRGAMSSTAGGTPRNDGVVRYTTENSVYEVDWDNNKVRRVSGDNDPTPYQGEDGVWKQAALITNHGDHGVFGLVFWWNATQLTQTSSVRMVEPALPVEVAS